MSEGLAKKKKIRGGHRSSATHTISTIYETIESTVNRESVMITLLQCKLMLKEKLETIKRYDDEILELVGDEEVENEIEQAHRVHRAIIDVTSAIETSRPTPSYSRATCCCCHLTRSHQSTARSIGPSSDYCICQCALYRSFRYSSNVHSF